jgi:hypothetical protein
LRKIWSVCGWVLLFTGVVLVLVMGIAWAGGARESKMIPCIGMGGLFMALGGNFVSRGKNFPAYLPADDSEVARDDRAGARRMIIQAIWIGGVIIILMVATLVGLWIFFRRPV